MTKTAQILAAMRDGAVTSAQIAKFVGSHRGNISVTLCRLADLGVVERSGSVSARQIGRPYLRWRQRTALARDGDCLRLKCERSPRKDEGLPER